MITKKVLRYYCEHCSRGHWKKQDCIKHEKICFYNPENQKCGSCVSFKKSSEYWCDDYEKHLRTEKGLKETIWPDKKYLMLYPEKCNRHVFLPF